MFCVSHASVRARRPIDGTNSIDVWSVAATSPSLDVDAVMVDEVLVELPAEPGAGRERELAVLHLGAVRDQVPPDRVAVGVEHLDVGPVRAAREQVDRDLRLLVVAELDAVELRRGGHARPVRVAAAPRRVEVADVDGAALEHVAARARRVLALAGADRDAAARPHLAHVAVVVRPDARLLEPADVELADAVAEVERRA